MKNYWDLTDKENAQIDKLKEIKESILEIEKQYALGSSLRVCLYRARRSIGDFFNTIRQ